MCLLALFFRVIEDAPVVVCANREEAYARGGSPPQLLDGPTRAVAGLDPVAGGTWLGINEHGVLVAVTNRAKSDLPDRPRSRGLLARELLACASAKIAADQAAAELCTNRYAGCNFLCVDRESAYVLHAGDWLRVRPLPAGLHLLSAHDVNDAGDPRLAFASWWLTERNHANGGECVTALQELCAKPGDPRTGEPAICLRGEMGGTVSSSIIVLRSPLSRSLYLHAQGAPDRTPFADCSPLLGRLFIRWANGD